MSNAHIVPGKLCRTSKTYKYVKVPSTDFGDMPNWDFELASIPENALVMVIRADRSTSLRNPYLKVFFLWGEQLYYVGDNLGEISALLRPGVVKC